MSKPLQENLRQAREDFIAQWGALGSAWGVNRTMAQIHALLLVSPDPLCTDEIMEDLSISRGNANTNLRELVSWGLLRGVVMKGERKDFFEAEKDVWKIFCTVARHRKRREIEPALNVLADCADRTRGMDTPEGKAFHEQMRALQDFVDLADSLIEKVTKSEQSHVVPAFLRLFK